MQKSFGSQSYENEGGKHNSMRGNQPLGISMTKVALGPKWGGMVVPLTPYLSHHLEILNC